ncbi:MAG: methylenetetrahydromethanopterin dehydrogenase [Gammaproteobacteria bacterium]|nr:methylenetetrahydromethanopterin dehydrogenase [Gammaproteobacteria bacterium]MCP5202436.1 methylenetetrahydromethanopterin dehydrogenase [Gammaproteobacteria bacterium]
MDHPHLLHIFSPTKYVSPFDINMAYEARFDGVIPYCNVELDEVHGLTQDTIFSRSPEGVRRTGIFIGGREFGLALDMLEAARAAMVPPFAISVMADPSGAITTAAAMVALAEHWLEREFGADLAGRRVCVFGGTGPVGMCVALLAARAGADCAVVSHQGLGAAQLVADRLARKFGHALSGLDGSSAAAVGTWLGDIELAFSTAKAGVRVLDADLLGQAGALKIAADANAVPPSGIEGVAADDRGSVIAACPHARGLGALAIGDIKYRVHTALLRQMHTAEKPVYLAYEAAYDSARAIVRARA